jgi:acyl-CoA thioesterase-1
VKEQLRVDVKSEFTRVFRVLCFLGVLLLLFVACNRDDASPAISRGASEMKPGPIVYVALGDSTGSGVGARDGGYVARLFRRVLQHRAGSELVNLCVSGATTEDVLRRQLQGGVEKSPDLVTVGIGINDIGHGFPLEQFAKNYEEILSTLKQKTQAAIVVTNIPDISSAPQIPAVMRSEYQRQIERFNERLVEIARRHDVTIFDIFTITRGELPSHPEYFSADGFHPSDEGYELWAEQMWPTMATVIGAN